MLTDEVISEIEKLVPLAPLHNPGNLSGIRAAIAEFPSLTQVAVFDTAFHQTMPVSSYSYAIDANLAAQYGVRKYGFHGSSYAYVTAQAAEFLGKDLRDLNAIILHLGNGASACAIKNGKSFDTSMGMSPLPGLVMGTRSGDIDPAIIFYLHNEAEMGFDEIDLLLNSQSGLQGLTGSGDLRDVLERAEQNEPAAVLAIEFPHCDALIMSAAVADAKVLNYSDIKIKKESLGTVELDKNPDILKSLSQSKKLGQVIVGFAAETSSNALALEQSGFDKLSSKSLDIIYVNNVSGGAIFGSDKTEGLIIDKQKNVIKVPEISKDTLSDILLDQLVSKLG